MNELTMLFALAKRKNLILLSICPQHGCYLRPLITLEENYAENCAVAKN